MLRNLYKNYTFFPLYALSLLDVAFICVDMVHVTVWAVFLVFDERVIFLWLLL